MRMSDSYISKGKKEADDFFWERSLYSLEIARVGCKKKPSEFFFE